MTPGLDLRANVFYRYLRLRLQHDQHDRGSQCIQRYKRPPCSCTRWSRIQLVWALWRCKRAHRPNPQGHELNSCSWLRWTGGEHLAASAVPPTCTEPCILSDDQINLTRCTTRLSRPSGRNARAEAFGDAKNAKDHIHACLHRHLQPTISNFAWLRVRNKIEWMGRGETTTACTRT